MVKRLFLTIGILLSLMCGAAFATTVMEVKQGLISQMQADGVITSQQAVEAQSKYVSAADTSQVVASAESESSWTKHLTWMNLVKVVGVVLLLVAFHGVVMNIVSGLWHLIVAVPVEVYQFTLGSITLFGLIRPEMIWASQAFYIALFSAFAFPIVLGWFLATHEAFARALSRMFNIGVPIMTIISAYAVAYFGVLAFAYESKIFGAFAVIAFSSMLSFGMTYRWGVLALEFSPPSLHTVVFGHALLLGGYMFASVSGALPAGSQFFAPGIEYYATIALGVALLCGGSPWWRRHSGFYSLLMIATFAFALYAYSVLGFTVVGTILIIFGILWFLEWLAYVSYSAHFLIGCTVTGAVLFGAASLYEQYGQKLVFVVAQ
jgi:hypothetical protein